MASYPDLGSLARWCECDDNGFIDFYDRTPLSFHYMCLDPRSDVVASLDGHFPPEFLIALGEYMLRCKAKEAA